MYGYPTYTTTNTYYYTTGTTTSGTTGWWPNGAYAGQAASPPPEPEPEPCTEDELIEFINGKES